MRKKTTTISDIAFKLNDALECLELLSTPEILQIVHLLQAEGPLTIGAMAERSQQRYTTTRVAIDQLNECKLVFRDRYEQDSYQLSHYRLLRVQAVLKSLNRSVALSPSLD